MTNVLAKAIKLFASQETVFFPTLQVDQELYSEIQEGLNGLTQNNGGPLLLVRPPRENDGMEATISVYETLHNPREKEVGFGPFKFTQNKAHAHAHEIWYHNAQMQFFLRPETRVDANKMRRQVRSNYPNVDISEADQRFPSIEVGEYVSVAEIGLKRDFYFPIKSKLHNNEDFELDPYGDITSDMVVEEDQTSDGRWVEAKDCKLVVQTIFESARDVWSKSRPYGMDVNKVAQGLKEGQVHGNLIKGYETRSPGSIQTRGAKILETLQGSKAYYITMRVIAISPFEEIAERRCRNVAYDFETYYNTITQQGLKPIELSEDQMRESLLEAVRREHDIRFRDRFMSNGKFLQPVATLGSLAHIPNEEINTPVIDWAKQDTGPGTPSSGNQLEDQERASERNSESGVVDGINTSSEAQPQHSTNRVDQTPEQPEIPDLDTAEAPTSQNTATDNRESSISDAQQAWNVGSTTREQEDNPERHTEPRQEQFEPSSTHQTTDEQHVEAGRREPTRSERVNDRQSRTSWGDSRTNSDEGYQSDSTDADDVGDDGDDDDDDDSEESGFTPAFARGNTYSNGWEDDREDYDTNRAGRRS